MAKVFIDGSAGTTGLRIYERLEVRSDIELIKLPEEKRKDEAARKEALNSADIAFLCLPDAAAIEAVSLLENDNGEEREESDDNIRWIDHPEWSYSQHKVTKGTATDCSNESDYKRTEQVELF